MRASPPVSRRLETLRRSPLAFCHLRPFLARLVIAGDVRHPAALRRVADLIALFPDHPSSPLLCRALSRLYFHRAPSCTTFLYNLIIRAFSRSRRHPCESLFAFVSLLRSAYPPDYFTFPSLLKAACRPHSPTGGIQIHPQVLRRGFESYIYVLNTLLSMYSAFGDMVSAQKLFDLSSELLDVVSWNTVVDGYVKVGALEVARRLFEEMPMRNEVSWSAIINGYAGKGELDVARSLFDRMPVQRNVVTWNSMNVSSWNALIAGLAINGAANESLEAFEQMQKSGLKPNDITFVGVLMACVHGGLVHEGQHYFESMTKVYGIQPEMKHYGCMVDLLGRAGLLEEAEGIVRGMPMKPDIMLLGALLGACRIHKDVAVADRVKKEVLQLKAQQSGCHVLLSNIFAAAGRWADASEVRSSLKQIGIRKDPGSSSVELDGIVYEFVAGSCSRPEASAIYAWLDKMGSDLRHQGYSPVTEDVLLDLSEEDKETWLSRHSEKLALAFALLRPKHGQHPFQRPRTLEASYKTPLHPFLSSSGLQRGDTNPTHNTVFLISPAAQPVSAMEMGKFACAVLVAAASATAALAADAPAPGPASASFAVTPAVGAVIGASVLSFFAFYLQ
ncbi:hypothetical protein BHM03_00024198 [Ensete ventricosum]|nr:hypothetical protein BHM03_00024198 [Ensete ventricosum]